MSAYERPEPALRSSRENDPEVELQIDAFVVRLGETVDALQDAESEGRMDVLRAQAEALQARTRELGYESLADAARQIFEACDDANPAAARKAVEDFTELSKRVRRGHRSAAP
jgi:DNA-binding FadR family transcriptional regulator